MLKGLYSEEKNLTLFVGKQYLLKYIVAVILLYLKNHKNYKLKKYR